MYFKNEDTIDTLHNKKIEELNKNESIYIPKFEKKIEEYRNIIENTDDLIEKKNYEIKIEKLKKKIVNIKNKKKEYYLNNSEALFEYFETKQNIQYDDNPKKIMNDFFNVKNDDVQEKNNNINKCVDTYLKNNNFESLNLKQYYYDKNVCEKCKVGELIKVNKDGLLVCNKCFVNFKYLVENDKPSYKEPPKEISFYAYKRINHFREILSQFQAKESTDIPNEIIDKIKKQIKKERIELVDMTNKKTKEILKKLGYNKYYEHIPFIKDKIGIKPPVMSPHLEETLCNLFMDIQIPYAKYCPNDRVNFLNYYYTLYKLCELLNEESYLEYFPMLKDQKKAEQDEIWKKICHELKWTFIPTI